MNRNDGWRRFLLAMGWLELVGCIGAVIALSSMYFIPGKELPSYMWRFLVIIPLGALWGIREIIRNRKAD